MDRKQPYLNGKNTATDRQERHSPNLTSLARPIAAVWIGSAFCAALGLAALVLAAPGPGERGTDVALQMTARLSFLLFWPAYAAGAMTALFGPAFEPFKQRAREFGLAFASAHLVHIALVVWLTYIGTLSFYGPWTYLLALFRSSVTNAGVQWLVVLTRGRVANTNSYNDGGVHGAPGSIAGAGLPFIMIGYGAYWPINRRRRKPD